MLAAGAALHAFRPDLAPVLLVRSALFSATMGFAFINGEDSQRSLKPL